jgi:DNA polymerase III subunit alpha
VEPPLIIALELSDDEMIVHDLFELVVNNQGKRELKILIKSKLADLELESAIKIDSKIEKLIHTVKGAYLVDSE